MGTRTEAVSGADPSLLRAITPPRRRHVVDALDGRDPVSVAELASDLAESENGDAEHRESVRTSLGHAHLPALAEADVVDYERQLGWVAIADSDRAARAVRIARRADDDDRTILDALANGRRQAVLRCLAPGTVCRTAPLAGRVLALERGCEPTDLSDRDREEAATSLHHAHLPKLEAAGLVEFRPAKSVVVRCCDLDPVVSSLLSPDSVVVA